MYKTILLPIDLNHDSSWKSALPVAQGLAKANGAKLHVMTVVPEFGMPVVGGFFPEDYERKAMDETKAKIKTLAEGWDLEGVDCQLHVAHGTIYEELLKGAASLGADLIVLASHRPELKDYLLGPNAARVVRHASCSVFVVRD